MFLRKVCACKGLLPRGLGVHTSRSDHFNQKDVDNSSAERMSVGQTHESILTDSWKGSPLPQLGFSRDSVSTILESCPDLKKVSERELSERVDVWLRCQFGGRACVSLLTANPQLLTLPGSRLHDRIVKLFNFFSTNKNVYKLISSSPNAVTENWSAVEAKINYLANVMKVPKYQIAGSGALAHSLDHIRARFVFLSRAGRYKLPKPKDTPETQFKNPKIADILNSEDKHFSTAIAGVSLLEFEAFQQMLNAEEEEENLDND